MRKPKALLEEVREALPPIRTGFPPWHQTLPPEAKAEVDEIKRMFLAGQLETKAFTLARILAAKLAERGLANVKPQTVSKWLRNHD